MTIPQSYPLYALVMSDADYVDLGRVVGWAHDGDTLPAWTPLIHINGEWAEQRSYVSLEESRPRAETAFRLLRQDRPELMQGCGW